MVEDLFKEYREIEDQIILAEGEISDDLLSKFNLVMEDLMRKVDSYYFILRKLEKNAELWSEESRKMKKISDGFAKSGEALKARIKNTLCASGSSDVQGKKYRFRIQPSNPRIDVDMEKISDKYKIVEQVVSINKEEIKKDLLSGQEVDGAKLINTYALKCGLNKNYGD